MFYNTKNQVPFEIYLTDEERQAFREGLSRDPVEVLKSFSRISTRASTCWVINDQNRIHGLIESSVGFDRMDQVVRDAIAEALKIDGKTESSVKSTISGERTGSSRSDEFGLSKFERDAENLFLKEEITKLNGKFSEICSAYSQLKTDYLQLQVENTKLNDEILQFRA